MQACTYIDEHKNFTTYKLDLLAKYGCKSVLHCRLRYAKTMVERIMRMKSASASSTGSKGASSAAVAPTAAVATHWLLVALVEMCPIFFSTVTQVWGVIVKPNASD